jgi:DNA-binding NarL/FixJ family response regulator
VDIIRIHADGHEMFCFVADTTDAEQINVFYRNLTHMKIFCDNFLANTVNHRQSCSFSLPPEMIPDISGEKQYCPYSIVHNYKTCNLTKRQFQCLALLTKGNRSKEIAYTLGISESTVNDYLSRIKIVLGLYETSALREIGLINNLHMIPDSLILA